ncbi:DNA ligase 3-like isoform X2 [Hydractinia symbiolongicarpus]|uniref:DNA ligase 3-like isoform X2 n=1 Tax=Hydractinia symbiolongicarpus TaxID=13093 RepID=UPI00254A7E53|nr:DNA ligase 3-like isoform X2 [Hydractinia symbiolongicarpus]
MRKQSQKAQFSIPWLCSFRMCLFTFSRTVVTQVFQTDIQEMTNHLEDQGVVSETIKEFFVESESSVKPSKKSVLTLQDVNNYLDELASVSKEEAQISVLRKISKKCTEEDLNTIVKLIKHDLRMNTGPKHFLDALDSNAYAAYQASSDLKKVIEKWVSGNEDSSIPGLKKKLSIRATLMTPVKPMLAEACKSVEHAFKKCPNGMFSEIKYDGERVQIHKDGDKFQYFSRSLKPVQPHKISEIKDYIPKACPGGDSLILDGEVLLMDTKTSKPLPFGTLGIHKKSKFKDATVCYVIFDILQFNNENLLHKPIDERRSILLQHVKQIDNRIIHSEMKELTKPSELQAMLKKCFAENLEGLVVKDKKSKYEPGKRHWLKIKKDYLDEGTMADTADLVVLGAYYGTGNKGGMMSVFLMGCYDDKKDTWVTVAKCGNGHDDDTLKKLQKQLKMTKISKDPAKVPSWLDVNRSILPDFVITNPKNSQVWEITGAEFSESTTHTANGISIRFPRVTKIRHDKDWKTATSLKQLQHLFTESKKTTDVETAHTTIATKIIDDAEAFSSKRKKEVKKMSSPGKKRKPANATDDVPESKIPKKLLCEYGSSCYRKNKEHLEQYSHDVPADGDDYDDDVEMKDDDPSPSKPQELINLFTDLRFLIKSEVKDTKKLKRFIIAFDGDVLEDYELDNATHVISNKRISNLEDSTKHVVKPAWIWACIEAKRLVAINKKLAFI